MPTEINGYSPGQETPLSSLVINEVDSTETFEKMKEKGLLQDNQLYLVTDEQPSAGIDEVPTEGSKNLVYSGGVYNALKQVGSADSVTEQNKGLKQKFWRGTKAEFDAVGTKSDDTMYIIVDDDGTIPTPDVSGQINAHNTNTEAHSDIRELITGLTTRLNTLADSDDTTLDQMSEIVAYIKNNKTLIDGITTSKVNVTDIIDNLTTNEINKPLSAAQGVALKALIDAIAVPTKTSELTNDSGYLTSFTETDPTVPEWAKATSKPTYTASEVGAATMTEVNSAIQTAIGNAIGGSY